MTNRLHLCGHKVQAETGQRGWMGRLTLLLIYNPLLEAECIFTSHFVYCTLKSAPPFLFVFVFLLTFVNSGSLNEASSIVQGGMLIEW